MKVIILLALLSSTVLASESSFTKENPDYNAAWGTCVSKICNKDLYYNSYLPMKANQPVYHYVYENQKESFIHILSKKEEKCYSKALGKFVNTKTCQNKIKSIDEFFLAKNRELSNSKIK